MAAVAHRETVASLCAAKKWREPDIMILVTRINKASQFYINEDMIEVIEETPDTIVTLNTGKKIAIMESAVDIVEKIREEKIRIRRATEF